MTLKERLGQQLGALIIANAELANLNDLKDARIAELEKEIAALRAPKAAETPVS